MKKKTIFAAIAITAVAGLVMNSHKSPNKQTSITTLANILALTDDDETKGYETRKQDTVSIWNDQTEDYKSITTIICEGKGSIVCP